MQKRKIKRLINQGAANGAIIDVTKAQNASSFLMSPIEIYTISILYIQREATQIIKILQNP